MKLNLGSGNRPLEGYIGVDLSPKADVVCDIRKLDFAKSSSVEEIIAIHVIEHFYKWEVQGILQEWRRVLHPKGKIVLECPNLEIACRNLLNGTGDQLSMWALYGNPNLKDELHCHHWLYTPQSLIAELIKAGFRNCTHKTAEFKIPQRDMRVEAFK
jgi:ubiquinone/menaquinone biosynthesis C-methylase UbiE